MKKITALFLLAALLLPLGGCARLLSGILVPGVDLSGGTSTTTSGTGKPSDSPDEDGGSGSSGDVLAPEPLDSVGDQNYGGKSVVFSMVAQNSYELYAEEGEGSDPISEAIYKRNKWVEDRLNVKIKPRYEAYHTPENHAIMVRNTLMNGDDSFDVTMLQLDLAGELVLGGWFYDLRKWVPYVKDSLSGGAAWWPEEVNTAFTVLGRQYVGVSDLNFSSARTTPCYVFNKQMVEDENIAVSLGYNSLYDYVKAGEWTIENVYIMVKDRYDDNTTSGAGVDERDDSDTYGILASGDRFVKNHAISAGFRTVMNDGETTPEITPYATILAFKGTLTSISKLASCPGYYESTETRAFSMFVEGQALLYATTLGELEDRALRDSEVAFGILPLPKSSTAQKEYYASLSSTVSTVEIPTVWYSTQRMDMVGAVIEVLSAESYRTLLPTYRSLLLDYKENKDGTTYDFASDEMLGYILDGRLGDFSQLHSQSSCLWAIGPSGEGVGLYNIIDKLEADVLALSDWWDAAEDKLRIRLQELVEGYEF